MMMHEALNFLDALTKHMEHSIAPVRFLGGLRAPATWTRPTRELVMFNLRVNRKMFGRDKDVTNSFTRQLSIALERHWIDQGACQPHCHARHLWLTATGKEVLKLMNEQGCGPQCAQHTKPEVLHLQRKVA
jgi:hypothetical protein